MIDRRRFIVTLAAGAAGLLVPRRSTGLLAAQKETKPNIATPAAKHEMAVVRGTKPDLATRKAVELIGGMGAFVSKGDVVLVKPNIAWDRTPEQAATTNPLVVATVVAMALEAGAKKVVVADNTCNDARRSYVRSGISEAAKGAGAEVLFMEDRHFVKTDLKGDVLKDWNCYRGALDADKIINVPIAKHHGLSGVTLSMKNLMGIIGGARNLLHQRMAASIVDLAAFFKPQLHILDAVRVLTANGPQGGSMKDVRRLDVIAASADPVRIEAFGVTLFGKQPGEFPAIALGEQRGLGTGDFKGTGFVEVNIG